MTKETESENSKGDSQPLTISEFQSIAKNKLRKQVWDYYVSGADDQLSIISNQQAFNQLVLRPRMFRDVSQIDTSITLFGQKYAFPVGISPSAMQKLVGGDGELDVARAAVSRETFMILSSNATSSLEDVMTAAKEVSNGRPVSFWFQLYVGQDRVKSAKLIKRAEEYSALVVTIDTPVLGNRINERKTQLILPKPLSLANLDDHDPDRSKKPSLNRELLQAKNREEARRIQAAARERGVLNDASLNWAETIPWLRRQTSMKIILKGVMTAEDARLAVEHGADAVIVSNHGGRQLDGVPATIEVLPEVVTAVQGRIPVLMDGGITRGSDVFKALALGADFCLVGGVPLWGLAHDGRNGVEMVLDILERELTRTMTLSGARDVSEIESSMLGVRRLDGFGIAKL